MYLFTWLHWLLAVASRIFCLWLRGLVTPGMWDLSSQARNRIDMLGLRSANLYFVLHLFYLLFFCFLFPVILWVNWTFFRISFLSTYSIFNTSLYIPVLVVVLCIILCIHHLSACWCHLTSSVQFSSVTQSYPTLCDPMDCSMPGFPVHRQLPELAQTHVHRVAEDIQPSHPLLSPSPPAFNLSQYQSLFQWVSSSHQVAKVLEFQLQHQSFQCIFGTDFL